MGTVGKKAQVATGAPNFLPNQRRRALDHNTREVTTGNARQCGVGKTTQYVFDIAGVESSGFDLYQDFIGSRYRSGDVDETEVGEIASGGELQCFHGQYPSKGKEIRTTNR